MRGASRKFNSGERPAALPQWALTVGEIPDVHGHETHDDHNRDDEHSINVPTPSNEGQLSDRDPSWRRSQASLGGGGLRKEGFHVELLLLLLLEDVVHGPEKAGLRRTADEGA